MSKQTEGRLVGKRVRIFGMLIGGALLFLLSMGCGSKDGASSNEEGGDIVFPGETITGTQDSDPAPFRSEGCEVQLSMTHADDSRFLLYVIDKSDGTAFKTIVYASSISNETVEFDLPEGDYWIEAEAAGGWSYTLTGCVYTYLNPNDYETDVWFYTGCPPPSCEDNGGVFGCECVARRCICNDDTLDDAFECGCGGSSSASGGAI